MTVQIIEFHGDEKRYVDALLKAQQRTQELEAELKKTGKASQDAAAAVGDAFKSTEQEQARVMNALRAQLRAIGPEGLAAAKAMSEALATEGKSSEVAVEGLLDKIKLINPAAAEAARAGFQSARDEISDVSKFSEGLFQKPLDKLRAMGPEGRRAAEMLKASLVDAGKISQRSMSDIVDELHKIDPAAAEMAKKIESELQDAADSSTMAMDGFATATISKLTAVGTGFASLTKLIDEYNNQLEKKRQLTGETLDKQLNAAGGQSDAVTNLASFDEATRKELLNETPRELSQKLQFGDESTILKSISNVAATGVDSKERIEKSVEAAVKLRRHKPEDVPQLAEAIADMTGKLSDLTEEEAAAALVTAQGQFRGSSFKDLSTAFPQVVAAVKATSPNLSTQEILKQSGALLSGSSNPTTDTSGLSSTTFSISFATQLQDFFTNMDRDRVEARSKVELIDRRIAKGKDTEKDRDDKRKALQFLADSEGVQDPGNPLARSGLVGSKEGLRERFLDGNSVEMRFKPVWRDMLTPGSESNKRMEKAREAIQPSADKFNETAKEMASATPQLRLATGAQAFKFADDDEKMKDVSLAITGNAEEKYKEYLAKSRDGSFRDVMSGLGDSFRLNIRDGLLSGESGAERLADFAGKLAVEDISDIRSGRQNEKREDRRNKYLSAVETSFMMSAEDFTPQEASKAKGIISSGLSEVERNAVNSMEGGKMTDEMRAAYEQNTGILMKLYEVLERIESSSRKTAENTDLEPVSSIGQLSSTAHV